MTKPQQDFLQSIQPIAKKIHELTPDTHHAVLTFVPKRIIETGEQDLINENIQLVVTPMQANEVMLCLAATYDDLHKKIEMIQNNN